MADGSHDENESAGAPEPERIREQLARVLASETFSTATRHRRLLQYLVERTLAGEGDRLKEYVVATEVLERPQSYDPRLDSFVRVEARRLRGRLESYYVGSGAEDPIVISIPRGSYVPVFSARLMPPATTAAAPVPGRPPAGGESPRTPRPLPAIWLVAGVALAGLLVLALWRLQPAGAADAPGVAVLPFESYSEAEEDRLIAAQLTDAVTAELAKFHTVSVASRTSTARYARDDRDLAEIARTLRVHFVMEASAVSRDEGLRVVVRLVDVERDRKVWVADYALTAAEVPAAATRISGDAAVGILTYRATGIARAPR